MRDTVFAEATAPGRAGLAVLRLSGPRAGPALDALAAPRPPPREARLRAIRDPESGELLDRGLALWFPGPASFTGEDAAELHLHGAPAVVDAVQAALMRLEGLRPAEPGEFTRRAFESGRMDLTAVEGLADLIAAETEGQRREALFALGGGLARRFEDWRARLVQALAHVEAAIDFADEELPDGLEAGAAETVALARAEMGQALAAGPRGEIVRDGFRVALVGAPNAGKSSLLNALAEREVAITSPRAGTTRDVLEARLAMEGHLVRLLDMAGLHESADPVEREGMRRARAEAAEADLCLLLRAPDAPPPPDMPGLLLRAKCDLGGSGEGLAVSARTGEGLEALRQAILVRLRERVAGPPGALRARHVHALREAVAALERFADAPQTDLAAEDLRLALRALGRVTGRVDVEELLDAIFREFCIGK